MQIPSPPFALGDFILHRVSDFGYYNHVITLIDCYVINSFFDYLDFKLVTENFSDVLKFYIVISETKL